MKNILFRTDASINIGTGHIMRCLTLANLLKGKGMNVSFICAETKGNLIDYIRNEGYGIFPIPERANLLEDARDTIELMKDRNVDLLIVDHYGIDFHWEALVKKSFESLKVMVIDDLANRMHECDLLLDQNFFNDYMKRYDEWIPADCRRLLGPNYLLLRPEFYQIPTSDSLNDSINEILVFYGGSDPTNETVKALEALECMDTREIIIHVVVGVSNPQKEYIEAKCKEKGYSFYKQINFLAQLMAKVDLSLGAGGVTMWERCFLGLPSIVTIVADNQRESTEAAAEFGAIWNLGWYESVKVTNIVDILDRAFENPEKLKDMSHKAQQLMQTELHNETHPVVEAILEVLT